MFQCHLGVEALRKLLITLQLPGLYDALNTSTSIFAPVSCSEGK